jgi:hypothetical protein
MVHHDGPREPEISLPSYLRRRGHTWFLRWKWPSRLAAFGFSGELIRSLRTSDFRIARRRALTLVLQIETMTESTQLPKRAELESAIRRWIDDSVWRQEIRRAETGGLDFLECHEIEKMGREDARELDGLFRYASNMIPDTSVIKRLVLFHDAMKRSFLKLTINLAALLLLRNAN